VDLFDAVDIPSLVDTNAEFLSNMKSNFLVSRNFFFFSGLSFSLELILMPRSCRL